MLCASFWGAMRQRILGSHTPPCHRRMVITTHRVCGGGWPAPLRGTSVGRTLASKRRRCGPQLPGKGGRSRRYAQGPTTGTENRATVALSRRSPFWYQPRRCMSSMAVKGNMTDRIDRSSVLTCASADVSNSPANVWTCAPSSALQSPPESRAGSCRAYAASPSADASRTAAVTLLSRDLARPSGASAGAVGRHSRRAKYGPRAKKPAKNEAATKGVAGSGRWSLPPGSSRAP
mmetsp:Transcript_79724/g.133166  ORF Transcript_79724/g.133166 Transcript_79724/m.133166 type:complete len:233 (+) Transcript_79724:863-1561(+)